MPSRKILGGLGLAALVGFSGLAISAQAQSTQVLNVYTSRHYDTDQAFYDNFTKQTGIRINRIEAGDDALIQRIQQEGASSPADILITVDAGRLYRAQQLGLLAPVKSQALEAAIPANLRDPEGHWFGFSQRIRLIFFNKDKVKAGEIARYEDLADPKWKGRVLSRSSSNIYSQSLAGAMLAAHGAAKTEEWAKGVAANLARAPQGGDTDQLRALAAGVGDVAISNHYYFSRLMKSDKPEDKAVVEKLGFVLPNQNDRGLHANISGAGLVKTAPNRANAIRFLEYMATAEAQGFFAAGNNEFPASRNVAPGDNLKIYGSFKVDGLNAAVFARNNAEALRIMDRAGWK